MINVDKEFIEYIKFCKSCGDKLEGGFCHDCDYEDIYGWEVE